MPLKISFGGTTSNQEDGIVVSGDTKIDLKVSQNSIQIQNVAKVDNTPKIPVQDPVTKGVPIWSVVLIALVAAIFGFAIRHFTFKKQEHLDNETVNNFV